MRVAYAVSILILVLLPLGVLAPTIDKDEMDLTDYHPRNFNIPQLNDNTYANPRDPYGRPGLELLQGGPGDLAYGNESAASVGTYAPGQEITILGRMGGWNLSEFTLVGVTIHIFWNTNITTPSSWTSAGQYNGITIHNGTRSVTTKTTNGTEKLDWPGSYIPEDYAESGFFNVSFNVPSLDEYPDVNIQNGNNSIVAYFLGNDVQPYYWEAGSTHVEIVGSAVLSDTPSNQPVRPGSNIDFTYQVTIGGTSTGVENASVEFDWVNIPPYGVTISAPGFNPDGVNTWRTNSSGYVTFRVNTSTETPFGSYDLYANITSLAYYSGEDDLNISLTNHDHTVTLTVENLFRDAIIEVTAQPVTIPAGYSTIVKVVTKFPNGTVIGDVPVNITISASSDATWQDFANISLIDEGNPEVKPGWNETNSTGEISWNFTSYYDEFGNYTPEGNVWVDAVADYGHWDYGQGTAKYQKFYFINGTNNQDWNNQFDNSTGSALFSIDNQWSFGHIEVGSIDQGDKIGADGWRQFRADTFQRDNITLVLVVYNNTISNRLANVPVTFWLNFTNGDGSGVFLYYWSGGMWAPATESGETVDTDGNGEIKIAINVTATVPKYMYVVLNATANFTDFSRFQYLNGSRDIGTRRYSDLPAKTASEKGRGFQVNPRYSYGEFDTTVLKTDNDSYALDHPSISQSDGVIRCGNWVNMKFQILNDSEPLANATVNFTLANPTNGVSLTVNTGLYPAASTIYTGYPSGWYLTDSNGYIELNITTSKVSSPKRKANVNVTANVSFSVFPYINATSDHTKQNETKNSTFTLGPQYVYGIVDATNPNPRQVPSGGMNITTTFTARDSALQPVRSLHVANWTLDGEINDIFALYSVTAGDIVNHTQYNFTITHDAEFNVSTSNWRFKIDGTITFTINPTTNTTPEGDYYLIVNVSYADIYDGLPYLNGTSNENTVNGTSGIFTIKEQKIISVTVTGTSGSLGREDDLFLVKRGDTQISINGTYLSSLGDPQAGPISIGWNWTKRTSNSSDIYLYQNISVNPDGTFSKDIVVGFNMPVADITVFADNLLVQDQEFNDTCPSNDTEVITYAPIRIVSDIFFVTGYPRQNREIVYVGQNCTIEGLLEDDNSTALDQIISAENVTIRGWDGTGFVAGTEINGTLIDGYFRVVNFSIPDDYSGHNMTIIINVARTAHYFSANSQSLTINVYSDVNQGWSAAGADNSLGYQNDSGYPSIGSDSGTIINYETVEIYNGTSTISGYLYDQLDRPLNETGANQVAAVRVGEDWNDWWQFTTTDSTGRFQFSFNNTDLDNLTYFLTNNKSWTVVIYFVTENGTMIWIQNITIDYHMVDFCAPTHITTMERDGTPITNGTVAYGTVVLYINATDLGLSDGVVWSGVSSDALTYQIPGSPSSSYDGSFWSITIDADSTIFATAEIHYFHFNITDDNGNICQYVWVFLVDITPPLVFNTTNNGTIVVGTNPIIFTIQDNTSVLGYTAIDNTTILFQIDSDDAQNGTDYFFNSTLTLSIDTATLSGENHTVRVWVSDLAGNQGTLIFNFKVDTTPPVIDKWGTQVDGSKVYVGTYTINITITDPDPASNISSVIAYVDDPSHNLTNPLYNSITGYYETTWSTSGYDAGIHTITVIANDTQGNQNSSSLRLDLVKITSREAQGTPPNLNWTGRLGTGMGNIVEIRVEDPDENGTIKLLIISYGDEDNELDRITLSLSETSSGTGIFIGDLSFSLQESSQVEGIIKVRNEGNVRITYVILMNDSRSFIAKWYGGTNGTISFDEESYDEGDTAVITLVDDDSNLDPDVREEISVTVSIGSSSQTVTLTETDLDSGKFTGQVTVEDGDEITVTYSDTTDQSGSGPTNRQDTAEILGKAKEGDDALSQILLLGIFNILALGGGVTAAFAIERYRHRLD